MKKLITLLLAAIMCLSLTSCITHSSGGTTIAGYESRIAGYESKIAELEKIIRGYEKTQNTGSGNENPEFPGTDPQETEPKNYKTIELTIDNWQEYFEVRPTTYGAHYNSFGEFEYLDFTRWKLYPKNDIAGKIVSIDDAAMKYNLRDGYYCWFEYNLDTGAFVQKNAATEEETGDIGKVDDKTDEDTEIRMNKDGIVLALIYYHLSESLNGNIYSFIGNAYGTIEVTKIKGTITISE